MASKADLLTGLALRRLAECYALAVDTGDAALLAAQFTPDGVLDAPRGTFAGHEALASVPPMMKAAYERTFHSVLNQVPAIVGDSATAQTYCIARHFFHDRDGRPACYEMTVRYQDSFARTDRGWRFSRRALVVEATRTFAVDDDRRREGSSR